MPEIVDADSPVRLEDARKLAWEYRDFLLSQGGADAEIVRIAYPKDKYAKIMSELPRLHGPPFGALRLVYLDGQPVGCGMVRRFDDCTAEIKRVFLRPEARGTGMGRALMLESIEACRSLGHTRIVMDTGKVLAPAAALYRALGFRECGPYQKMPPETQGLMLFFDMQL